MNFSVTGFKKKIVVLLIVIALGNGVLLLGPAQSIPNETESEESITESDQSGPADGAENRGLFANDPDFTDRSGYGWGKGEFFFRATLAILFVVVLGVTAIYVSKKVLPKITMLPGKEIRIVETVHLGPRKAVHLLEIGNRRFLIGSTNENVMKIADITSGFTDLSAQETNGN